MTLPILTLQSEKYSATGNLAAEGFRKLLGAPGLNLLQMVVREAVQNCCDAAKSGSGPEIHFRLRRLNENQLLAMRHNVFHDLPRSSTSEAQLRGFLEQDEPWVLEICDFNTVGLAGPTRSDKVPVGNNATDFIDFLRNVGSRRDTAHGGGTYGYGKTSLYLSSRCSTIIVDSQTQFMTADVRRFLACHLGGAYELSNPDGSAERRTGRHWWGRTADDDAIVDPLEGPNASALAEEVGFLPRAPERRGTSIMILDPFFVGEGCESPETVIGMIGEAILWYFWPRLMSDVDPSKRIQIHLEFDDQIYPLPSPEAFPPLDLFTAAMKEVRGKGNGSNPVNSERPRKHLGRLAIQKGLRAARVKLVSNELTVIPRISSHIAVMRPVELVVRYYESDPLPDQRVEWAGVFVCDGDPEVEGAFAAAEPPAHDDWEPKILPKGAGQTYVNVAVRKIREAAQSVAAPNIGAAAIGGGGPSLARIAGQFGRFLDAGMGQGAGPEASRAGTANGGRKKNRVSQPFFVRLEKSDRGRVAVFGMVVEHDGRNPGLSVKAIPLLVMDGGAAPASMRMFVPAVLNWQTPDGKVLSEESSFRLNGYTGELEIRVLIPYDSAVTVKALLAGTEGAE